jgi:hypothetical protein
VRSGGHGHGVPRVLDGEGAGQRHRQIAGGCRLYDPRSGPGAGRAACRTACADRHESVLRRSGVLDPEIFISHRMPLERYADALELFRAGQGRKIQVLP